MKVTFTLCSLLLTCQLIAQTPDSIAVIRQVDSLLDASNAFMDDKKFPEALPDALAAFDLCKDRLGELDLRFAKCQRRLGEAYSFLDKHTEAEKLLTAAKDLTEKLGGKESAEYAACLDALGACWYNMDKYKPSEQAQLECLALREKLLGKSHPDYAASVMNLALFYHHTGKRDKALPLFLEAKELRAASPGKESRVYAFTLARLAGCYNAFEQYTEAEALLLEALAIQEKLIGKAHFEYAMTALNLGGANRGLGRMDIAEKYYLEAVDVAARNFGMTHSTTLSYRVNLAQHYIFVGQYENAEALLLESLRGMKAAGMQDATWSKTTQLLGRLYRDMGLFEKAEPLLLEGVESIAQIKGKDNQDYTNALNGLGIFYRRTAQYDKAEAAYLEVKTFREKFFGKEHVNYAHIIENLGVVFQNNGQYDKAEQHMLEAKAIKQKAYSEGKPAGYENVLINLSSLYLETKQYDKSFKIGEEALVVSEKLYGKYHPTTAHCIHGMGSEYFQRGQWKEAENWYLEAYTIRDSLLGKTHPDYISTQMDLANCRLLQGDKPQSIAYLQEVRNNMKKLILQNSNFQSANEFRRFMDDFRRHGLDNAFAMSQILSSEYPELAGETADEAFLYKGFILENSLRLEKSMANAPDSLRQAHIRWKGLQRRLGDEYAKAKPAPKLVAELEADAELLEKSLQRKVNGFSERKEISWKEVQASLKADEVAIEFIHYQWHSPKLADSVAYSAMVIRADEPQPRFILLCEARPLEVLLQQGNKSSLAHTGKLYSGTALYDLIWKPLEASLDGINTIYLAPSGLLHRLNFGAISIHENRKLANEYRLVALGSTRQLVQAALLSDHEKNRQATVFGGIRYEMDSLALAAENTDLSAFAVPPVSLKNANRSLLGNAWQYLPSTEQEAEDITSLLESDGFRVNYRKGYAASEEAFKDLGKGSASPQVLHLATHGYFFPDPKSGSTQQVLSQQLGTAVGSQPVFKVSELPLMRSGLILAGANHAWQNGEALTGIEDGIMTAYEISQMDLSGTELVVLSACETGLGDLAGYEGVFGLQRAFKIAGAKHLLMSLWQVPDKQSQEFMTIFYKHWLTDKLRLNDAFRATQLAMRERYESPFYWAGFVLLE